MTQVKIARILLITAAVVSLSFTPMNVDRRLMDVPENLLPKQWMSSKDTNGHDEDYTNNKDTLVEKVVSVEKHNKQENEIRYASFGSSVTWGAALEDRRGRCHGQWH